MKILALLALLCKVSAIANEGDSCLSNDECDSSERLKCGFYNDYKESGDYLYAKCI